MFWWTVIGTAASVIGLGVSIYLITVARGAREAARAARASARRRHLIDELDGVFQKVQEVGSFIQHGEWMAVRLRAEEVHAACKLVLTRWPDQLSEERRNELMSASTLIVSIAKKAAGSADIQLTPGLKRKLTDTHLRASGHISSALGAARWAAERDGDRDADG